MTTKNIGAWLVTGVVSVAALGGITGCADTASTPEPVASVTAKPAKPAAQAKREARERQAQVEAVRLTSEGSALTDDLVAWSRAGSTDPLTACATLKANGRKLTRLESITRKLERNPVAKRETASQLGSLRASVDSMRDMFGVVEDGCAAFQ